MSLLDILRSGVKTIDNITKPLQCEVQYQKWTAGTGDGGNTHTSTKKLRAIVDGSLRRVEAPNGTLMVVGTTVIFLDIDALIAATGGTGVETNDIIILPNGKTNPVRNVGGFTDPGTGIPIATEAYLG